MKEGFYAQLKVVFDKLTGAENKPRGSPQEVSQSEKLPESQAVPSFFSSFKQNKYRRGALDRTDLIIS